jgi:hypothetical protein
MRKVIHIISFLIVVYVIFCVLNVSRENNILKDCINGELECTPFINTTNV